MASIAPAWLLLIFLSGGSGKQNVRREAVRFSSQERNSGRRSIGSSLNLHMEPGTNTLLEVIGGSGVVQGNTAIPAECEGAGQGDSTLNLLRMLRPCVNCGSYQRVGSANDGGYIMCSDLLRNLTAGYSFGINGVDDWGIEISQTLGVPIFEFDCWNSERPKCRGDNCNLTFHEECLTSHEDAETDRKVLSKAYREGKTSRSLKEHLSRTSPSSLNRTFPLKGGHLLLKLDVEGSEWGALSHTGEDVLRQMRQIVVEFHRLDFVECHAYFAGVLRKVLDSGFAVAHIHGNNWGSMDVLEDGQYMIPDVLEVTFVNKRALSDAVLQQSRCSSEEGVLPEDARNRFIMPDLPLAELPDDVQLGDTPMQSGHVVKCRFLCALRRVPIPRGLGSLCLCLVLGAIVVLLVYKACLAWWSIRSKHVSWFLS